MLESNANTLFQRLDQFELNVCLAFNKGCQQRTIHRLFTTVSRLGNGVFWYVLIALIPLVAGVHYYYVSLHMFAVGLAGVLLYKILKKRLVRERPFFTHPDIQLGTAPLDKFSFPSGHTLHAFAFTIVACTYFPVLALILFPFTLLVAFSRIILGLHYPSDVLAGAAIGTLISFASFPILGELGHVW